MPAHDAEPVVGGTTALACTCARWRADVRSIARFFPVRGEQSIGSQTRPEVRDSTAAHDAASDQSSRAQFLFRALAAGGVVAGGVALSGLPRLSMGAPSPQQDVRVLNLLLLVEYTEAAFYREALQRGGLTGELRRYAQVVGAHEREHLRFLKKQLGRKATREPSHAFGDSTRDPDAFVAAAVALEDLTVAAYNGQATNVTRPVLAAAATIVSVEARHAAWIRSIAGRRPAPGATDPARRAARVRDGLRKAGLGG
jgi:rubrerythrin